ncbi:hypothetical protein HYH03_000775 [Edaphochlamys debaryana]|uniref:FAS1 domain-containing protein n=1 Tax=Edaphochlamys debaryana TaxID=47281 RepID=A0A836C579_9CHLO|nr:hypothetical protein HYH03_000775 [Edaphochlamys debaryana]|eukprot:KAG2500951.1 hypothetical protein HYH03_000775 [Edaphochlamys debaryana]
MADPDNVAAILGYHAIPGVAYTSTELPPGVTVVPTLYGMANLTIDKNPARVHIRGVESEADVTVVDLVAGKSVVHLINYILLPFPLGGPIVDSPSPSPYGGESPSPPVYGSPSPSMGPASPLEALAARPDCRITYNIMKRIPMIAEGASNPNLVSTFFAPNDVGFMKALMDNGLTLDALAQSDEETIARIFGYHTILGAAVKSTDLQEGTIEVGTALPGFKINVTKTGSAVSVQGLLSSANVVVADVMGGKSVIHIIDYVLLPFPLVPPPSPPPAAPGTINSPLDALAARPDCTLAYRVIRDTPRLAAGASDPTITTTFFTPNDDAFRAIMAVLGIAEDQLGMVDQDTLAAIFAYHTILGVAVKSTDLPEGTIETATGLAGYNLTITKAGSDVTVQAILSTAKVVVADVPAGKSVIHIVDAVLIPFEIPPLDLSPMPSPSPSPSPSEVTTPLEALAARPDCTLAYRVIRDTPRLAAGASNPNVVSTFFTPNDDAFRATLAALSITEDQLGMVNVDTLAAIFAYHTILGAAVKSTDLPEGTIETGTALPGYNLTITRAGSDVTVQAVLSTAKVVVADVPAGKSVIHIVDAVLIPFEIPPLDLSPMPSPSASPSPSEVTTPLEALAARPDCTLVYTVLRSFPLLAESASDPNVVSTFFAPNDVAFRATLATLGVAEDQLGMVNQDTVTMLFAYHTIYGAAVKSTDLPDGTIETTTALPGFNLTVTKAGSDVTVQAILSTAKVVVADVSAGKSVIHVIDAVLIPFEIPPLDVSPSPGNESPAPSGAYPTVAALIAADAQLSQVLGPFISSAGPLSRMLNDPEAEFTLFVPKDVTTFMKIIANLGGDAMRMPHVGLLMSALYDGLVMGKALMAADLTDGQIVPVGINPQLENSTIQVVLAGSAVSIVGAAGPCAVTKADMMGGKAVVHMLDNALITERTYSLSEQPDSVIIPQTDKSAFEALATTPGTQSTTVSLLSSGFVTAVTDPSLVATMFVPTDMAWARMLEANPNLNMTDIDALNQTTFIDEILGLHVVLGAAVLSSSLSYGQVLPVRVDGSASHTVSITADGVFISSSNGAKGKVVTADLVAGAGIIHLVDNILLTDEIAAKYGITIPAETMPSPSPEEMTGTPYPNVTTALAAEGLNTLLDMYSTAASSTVGALLQAYLASPFTLFAPTDEAFSEYFTSTGTSLATLKTPGNEVSLAMVVLPHLNLGAAITPNQMVTGKMFLTGMAGIASAEVTVSVSDTGVVTLSTKSMTATVIKSGISLTEGSSAGTQIYVIDKVLKG